MKKWILISVIAGLVLASPAWAMEITTKDGKEVVGAPVAVYDQAGKDVLQDAEWEKDLKDLTEFIVILETEPGKLKSVRGKDITKLQREEPYDTLFISYQKQIKRLEKRLWRLMAEQQMRAEINHRSSRETSIQAERPAEQPIKEKPSIGPAKKTIKLINLSARGPVPIVSLSLRQDVVLGQRAPEVIGEVKNSGKSSKECIELEARLYKSGRFVAAETGYVEKDILHPGESSSFSISFWPDEPPLFDAVKVQIIDMID